MLNKCSATDLNSPLLHRLLKRGSSQGFRQASSCHVVEDNLELLSPSLHLPVLSYSACNHALFCVVPRMKPRALHQLDKLYQHILTVCCSMCESGRLLLPKIHTLHKSTQFRLCKMPKVFEPAAAGTRMTGSRSCFSAARRGC